MLEILINSVDISNIYLSRINIQENIQTIRFKTKEYSNAKSLFV